MELLWLVGEDADEEIPTQFQLDSGSLSLMGWEFIFKGCIIIIFLNVSPVRHQEPFSVGIFFLRVHAASLKN